MSNTNTKIRDALRQNIERALVELFESRTKAGLLNDDSALVAVKDVIVREYDALGLGASVCLRGFRAPSQIRNKP